MFLSSKLGSDALKLCCYVHEYNNMALFESRYGTWRGITRPYPCNYNIARKELISYSCPFSHASDSTHLEWEKLEAWKAECMAVVTKQMEHYTECPIKLHLGDNEGVFSVPYNGVLPKNTIYHDYHDADIEIHSFLPQKSVQKWQFGCLTTLY
ncbi:hypothetical protein PR048_021388 [Dryococelus australis]|uniref:Uncharacterized protein n=1 Tax=Dryococelus australis TaxID=614101 RepID=A0ABQ9GY85_9NEOP|nr:hypothetical protein PR048_021388 [Dryococelus australis]